MRAKSSNLGFACAVASEMSAKSSSVQARVRMSHPTKTTASVHRMCRRIWYERDNVVRLDPKNGQLRLVQLPSRGVGIRKMVVDAEGRLWYMGSHNGRLGVVQ